MSSFLEKMLSLDTSTKLHLDFANDEHFAYILDSFGGEEQLTNRFPAVYDLLQYSRHRAEKISNMPNEDLDGSETGWHDFAGINAISYSPTSCAKVTSTSRFTEKKPLIIITSKLIEERPKGEKIVIAATNGYAEEQVDYTLETKVLASRLSANPNRKFEAVSNFYYSDVDERGNEYLTGVVCYHNDCKSIDNTAIVSKIGVSEPASATNNDVILLYNRTSLAGEKPDYVYDSVEMKNDKFNVVMPFSGTITFDNKFTPKKIKDKDFMLYIANENGTAYSILSAKDAEVSIANHKLEFSFPDKWECWLDVSSLGNHNLVDFHCNFDIEMAEGFSVTVVMDSRPAVVEDADAATYLMQKVLIWWGCFGKDTTLITSGGKEKNISQLSPGDTVLNAEKQWCVVTDVIRGQEEKMIYIQTYSMKEILLTESHPILTERGYVKAGQLNAADKVATKDGFEGLRSLNLVEYEDVVYNVCFEEKQAIFANHFIVGDFISQQEIQAKVEIEEDRPLTEEQLQLRKEVGHLMQELNSRGDRNESIIK